MNRPEQKPNEVPISFVNSLNQNQKAKHYFSSLADQDKLKVISYIQISATGEEEKQRTHKAVNGLEHFDLDFLSTGQTSF